MTRSRSHLWPASPALGRAAHCCTGSRCRSPNSEWTCWTTRCAGGGRGAAGVFGDGARDGSGTLRERRPWLCADEDSESVETDYLDSPRSGRIPPGLNARRKILSLIIFWTFEWFFQCWLTTSRFSLAFTGRLKKLFDYKFVTGRHLRWQPSIWVTCWLLTSWMSAPTGWWWWAGGGWFRGGPPK